MKLLLKLMFTFILLDIQVNNKNESHIFLRTIFISHERINKISFPNWFKIVGIRIEYSHIHRKQPVQIITFFSNFAYHLILYENYA